MPYVGKTCSIGFCRSFCGFHRFVLPQFVDFTFCGYRFVWISPFPLLVPSRSSPVPHFSPSLPPPPPIVFPMGPSGISPSLPIPPPRNYFFQAGSLPLSPPPPPGLLFPLRQSGLSPSLQLSLNAGHEDVAQLPLLRHADGARAVPGDQGRGPHQAARPGEG